MPDIIRYTLVSKNSDEDVIKFLKHHVNKSGFSLESKVADILSKKFSVSRETPFFDKDEKIGRAIDMTARIQIPDESFFDKNIVWHIGQLVLIIECKNVPGNIWLFSENS